jgi:Fe-S cluster assembly protein SufD
MTATATEPAFVTQLRKTAAVQFADRGFPTTRDEDWKYTSTLVLARGPFTPATATDVDPDTLEAARFGGAFSGREAVFVNGRFDAGRSSLHSLGEVAVLSLREALATHAALLEPHLGRVAPDGSAFDALNSSQIDDGAVVIIPEGTVATEPIHLLFLSAGHGTVSHPRVLVLAGERCEATIVETFAGREGDTYWTNAVCELVLQDGALLDHTRLQRESTSAFHVGSTAIRQGRNSRLRAVAATTGAALSRHDVRQAFAGEGAECGLYGFFATAGTQHADTHTWIDHAVPHCSSRQVYKGLLDDRSRGVFVGNILVRKDAQKTDAVQTNKNLLLSKDALVDSVPQLEILANDVKCKHGSTTGQIDAAALFYLRSRGIAEADARAMLSSAFAADVLAELRVPVVRESLERHLRRAVLHEEVPACRELSGRHT